MVAPGSIPGCGVRVTSRRALGSRAGLNDDMGSIGQVGCNVDLGLDVASTGRIDDGPDLAPRRRQRVPQFRAEREVPRLEVNINFCRIVSPLRQIVANFLDAAAGTDRGTTVGAFHVLENPTIGVNLEPPRQVANRIRQVDPRDLAALVKVDLGVDVDQPLGMCFVAGKGSPVNRRMGLYESARVIFVDDRAHVRRHRLFQSLVNWHRARADIKVHDRVDTGIPDDPAQADGLAADEALKIDAQDLVRQAQGAGEMIKRVRKMAIDRRDIAASRLRTQGDGLARRRPHRMHFRVYLSARPKHVPEIVVFRWRAPRSR